MMFMTLKALVLKLHAARREKALGRRKAQARMCVAKLGKRSCRREDENCENNFQFHSQLLEDMQSKSRPKVCKI
jgi:hypothetical protein